VSGLLIQANSLSGAERQLDKLVHQGEFVQRFLPIQDRGNDLAKRCVALIL
jgi:hypothetical protein